ncbi:AraC family transcriptional regulator [Caballeronia sp. LZ029]|uniref:AraC-like ligand-binding domain-containing protein n=1 Tax=Caballeronia sp. LZ029 TaxID=3038564 RepID=UPI0028649C18|nr:AraC family transcriptional regulator [Caballeronia sp. LZ029]MDR5747867.1 AraC family transcriptional regulator [Caballeronia sp. LZ029]
MTSEGAVADYSVNRDLTCGQKVDAWLQLLSEMFVTLEYEPSDGLADRELQATISHRPLAGLDTHLVSSTRQTLRRGEQRSHDNEGEFFLVVMQVAGSGDVMQDDRLVQLAPGDFTMYDTTRPYVLDFPGDFQQFVIRVPREELRMQVPLAQDLTAHRMAGARPISRLLSNVIAELPATIDECDGETLSCVAESVTDLIAANLRALRPSEAPEASKRQRYHEARIKAYIRENARDSELTIPKVASALGMSVSALYRAFASQGVSAAEALWYERLKIASIALRNRALENKSIKEIAFDSGFSDAAHFSRTFRQQYGESPREYRASWSHPSSRRGSSKVLTAAAGVAEDI